MKVKRGFKNNIIDSDLAVSCVLIFIAIINVLLSISNIWIRLEIIRIINYTVDAIVFIIALTKLFIIKHNNKVIKKLFKRGEI